MLTLIWSGHQSALVAAPAAVCGRHTTPYGTEYLVRRDAVPAGMALGQVNIEDLFVFMAKEV